MQPTWGKRQRGGGTYLLAQRNRRLLRRSGGQGVSAPRATHGGLLRARDSRQIRPHPVPRLPPAGGGWRRGRPLDTGGALRYPGPGARHGTPAATAQDHHFHRHDVQLVECRPQALLQCHAFTVVVRLCGQALANPFQRAGAVPARYSGHQRQCLGGATGEVGAGPGYSDSDRHPGQATVA
ncbi:hypothetical protein D3C78_1371190 [compost metagenome]